jgi:short-subunit dehydrogenase
MGLNRPFLTRYGPWAVITGASSGIGREAARELAARGMNLVLVARQEAALQSLRKEVTERHAVQCLVIAVDLATPSAREAVIARTQGLDVGLLISAAGFGTSGDFLSNPLWPEIEMLAVNVAATLDLTWHFGRRFAEQARGGIVLMSSIFAFQGVPRSAHYAATKAWVQTFAEGLREELKGRGVDVLASAPGPVATGFASRADMRMQPPLGPRTVARVTLDALGHAGTVRPGWLSKALAWSLGMLPRPGRTLVLSRVVKGMTAHHKGE